MNIGYIRVSTKVQNLDRQIGKMKELGIEDRFLFQDKSTGRNIKREQYKALKQVIREGDVVYFDSLDRLGRNYDLIKREWHDITKVIKADVVILDSAELFDSRKFRAMGDMGKLLEDQLLAILAYTAELDVKKIQERTNEGLEKARERGSQFGRKEIAVPDNFVEVVQRWQCGDISCTEAQQLTGLKPATFYRRFKEVSIEMDWVS